MRRRRRDSRFVAVIALLVAILGLSLGFAALSSTLMINGSLLVKQSEWDIAYEPLTANQVYTYKINTHYNISSPGTNANQVTFTNQGISNFGGTLFAPGDQLIYVFKVTNNGDYNAKIKQVPITSVANLTYSGDSSDIIKIKNKLTISFTEVTCTDVSSCTSSGYTISTNTVLNPGQSKNYKVAVIFDKNLEISSPSDLPINPVTITNLSFGLVFEKTD